MAEILTTREVITFEGTAPAGGENDTFGDGTFYDGLTFTGNMGTLDKAEYAGDPDGYESAARDHDLAFLVLGYGPIDVSSTEKFSMKNAIMASAWTTGEVIEITGYDKHGNVHGTQDITLTQAAQKVVFDASLHGIYGFSVDLVSEGSAGNPDANDTSGDQIAMDNLVVAFQGEVPGTGTAHVPVAHHAAYDFIG